MTKVLAIFGFNDQLCGWINMLLSSAWLSINFNGKFHGFFQCIRGVRQGDPLSSMMFCLAEEVLSRSISHLVAADGLKLIKSFNNNFVPSHIFYADDILIFCSGKKSNIVSLQKIFMDLLQFPIRILTSKSL